MSKTILKSILISLTYKNSWENKNYIPKKTANSDKANLDLPPPNHTIRGVIKLKKL
jgi:hypothetical protein